MSEKKQDHPRDAAEIIRYCEKRDVQSYLRFDLHAHLDLPAVTKVAVRSRQWLRRLCNTPGALSHDEWFDVGLFLRATAWLEPKAAAEEDSE